MIKQKEKKKKVETEADEKEPEKAKSSFSTPDEIKEKRLFGSFQLENLPDISQANIPRLAEGEACNYRTQMIDMEYLIVIHCTHGVNRSGYMVTRYLMDRLGTQADYAIELVSTARGHTMNRESYLRVLVDDEILDYAREQARYSYLIDLKKYWKYVPGTRFTSAAFVAWREKKLRETNH